MFRLTKLFSSSDKTRKSKQEPFTISQISTSDNKNVCIKFQKKGKFYACSDKLRKQFHSDEKNQLVLPINTNALILNSILKQVAFSDFEDKGFLDFMKHYYAFTDYKIYESTSCKYLGKIVFKYAQKKILNNDNPFLIIDECSFSLPTTKDSFRYLSWPKLSKLDHDKLLKKIDSWSLKALLIICSSKSDLIERCSLIIQYLWSSNPLIKFPPEYVNRLSFIEKLQGLETKEFPLLCGGYGELFITMVNALMPDIKIRHINGFECHYPVVFQNIHVISHVYTEVLYKGRWIYIDPFFQIYLKNRSEKILGIQDIRKIIKSENFDELVPVHFPANVSKYFIINGEYNITKILSEWGIFRCFNWVRCSHLVHCNETIVKLINFFYRKFQGLFSKRSPSR